jgi:hypothetical protein
MPVPAILLAAFEAVGLAAEVITPAIIAAWEASVAGGAVASTAAAAAARLAAKPVAKTGLKALLTSTPAKFIGGTAAAGLIFGGVGEMQARAMHGSTEDQIRESMEIQRRLEAQNQPGMAGGGGGGGGEGLDPQLEALLSRPSQTQSSLLLDEDFSKQLGGVARSFKGAARATNPRSEELEALIKGNEAALMQLQSERTLTTAEIIQMMESMDG